MLPSLHVRRRQLARTKATTCSIARNVRATGVQIVSIKVGQLREYRTRCAITFQGVYRVGDGMNLEDHGPPRQIATQKDS